MKNIFKFFLLVLIITSGCEKKDEPSKPVEPKEPYIKSLITPATTTFYTGIYYIHINFNNPYSSELKELTLSEANPNWSYPSDDGTGMTNQIVQFRDSKSEISLEIHLHFNTKRDSLFNIRYADYYFSDPWNNVAGANIFYTIREEDTPENYSYYLYLGTNTNRSYFDITYIGNNRINGNFSTLMKECCGGTKTYNVTGDFSIPDPMHAF